MRFLKVMITWDTKSVPNLHLDKHVLLFVKTCMT